jgi:NADH dehydrogenase [ubiquinone] 1 alpha subcomplex assembly factor 7
MDGVSSLELEIRRLIAAAGPMPVAQYVSLCLTHPVHGYYVTRDPFGAKGDFTTAPEVSQMFGELLGLWAAMVWRIMGSPEDVRLIELGPGRGTMMRDALRAMTVTPDFRKAIVVHLVEISPKLEKTQRDTLGKSGAVIHWHRTLSEIPAGPAIILANEFIDALPVHQMVKQAEGWHERVVALNAAGNLVFGLTPHPVPHFERVLPKRVRDAPIGSIYEWRSDNDAFEIGRRVRDNGAALIVDYGHSQSAIGDTLQAVGQHAYTDALGDPGSVDITAHVDFEAVGMAAESMGAAQHGPIEQGDLLLRLGIEARANALKAAALPEKKAEIDAAVTRLTQGGQTGMGRLFKAMALADPKLGPLPAFEAE